MRLQILTFVTFNDFMKISGSDLHLLTVFDCVVRNGGFSAAQAELGLSQPTISNHITALEERLGIRLCQRGRRGFMLTEKGRMVHEVSQDLFTAIGDSSSRLAELRGNMVGSLRVATVDCISTDDAMKLPDAISSFINHAPMIRFELSQQRPQEILRQVMDGALHVGIGSFDKAIHGLEFVDLYAERHSFYCGASHPLFHVPDADITEQMIEDSARIDRGYWSRQRQRALNIREIDLSVHEIESQLMIVLSGRYIGLLPDHLARSYVDAKRLRKFELDQDPYICQMQMVTKSGKKPVVIRAFCETLVQAHRE
ncbi:LysR family transcriptional regulator [Denitrobaculum tricleocarpae]|uniref:LysR family transcriptional regulator n=2 Tax=Denitrobaculum tricleocarpae TaxID=2591009 RepID=A0A545SY03_9PROT|nr:LysR family transcriptional regulator [Denitrobaculum tricleocarpae]